LIWKEMSMGRIAVHEFITLDGVMDNPSWASDYSFDPGMGDAIAAIMSSSKAILLGRRTYDEFAPSWSTRTVEDDPGAPFMNDTPKYVVSASLKAADWGPSTILPYAPDAIEKLKNQIDGNIYVSGSGTLVRAMLADSLVDDMHLFMYPLALGSGQRLFTEGARPANFALARSVAYDNGVVYLAYARTESASAA